MQANNGQLLSTLQLSEDSSLGLTNLSLSNLYVLHDNNIPVILVSGKDGCLVRAVSFSPTSRYLAASLLGMR